MKTHLLGACALLIALAPLNATAEQPQAPAQAGATAQTGERLLPLEGVQNARDIGGYQTADGRTVKWGLIYRTAGLSGLTQGDIQVLTERGLRSIHDLRSLDERQSEPTTWTGEGAPAIISHDYTMDSMIAFEGLLQEGLDRETARAAFASMYPTILTSQRNQHRTLFADLLTGAGPVLYHCSAGKDRTGVATALILAALGVPRETILQDYELSNQYYQAGASFAGAEADPRYAAFLQMPEDILQVFMGVDAAYLQAAFDFIDKEYGSVEAYLEREVGVDAQDIARLKALYTF